MRDWQDYWTNAPQVHDENVFRQVGKTIKGSPITEVQLEAIVHDICLKLELNEHDSVLDLCCGNGLITCRVAPHCAHVTGIDFSKPLLKVARGRFGGPNLQYVHADVSKLPASVKQQRVTKIYLYEALQHLSLTQVTEVFKQIIGFPGPRPWVYLGAVPDRDRVWNFYDTPERRREYERHLKEGTEPIGHWWRVQELEKLAETFGFGVKLFRQSAPEHGAHYRFDALCVPLVR